MITPVDTPDILRRSHKIPRPARPQRSVGLRTRGAHGIPRPGLWKWLGLKMIAIFVYVKENDDQLLFSDNPNLSYKVLKAWRIVPMILEYGWPLYIFIPTKDDETPVPLHQHPPSSPVECRWFDVLCQHLPTLLDSGWITDRKALGTIGSNHRTIMYNESLLRISSKVPKAYFDAAINRYFDGLYHPKKW